jgi:hypothetical protein
LNFLQSSWILAFVFAIALYGSGKLESHDGMRKGLLWATLSIAISVLVIQLCGGDWLFELLAQIGLFVGIAAVRTLHETKKTAKPR